MLCLSGPYDLELAYRDSIHQNAAEGGSVRGMLGAFLGGTPTEAIAQYRDASPMTWAGKSAIPAFLTHGTADPLVPDRAIRPVLRKAEAAGVDVR